MTTVTTNYAATAAITITLAGLANAGWRQSSAVDNSVNKYLDALVGGSIQVGTIPTDKSQIEIYAYGERDDGGGTSKYTAGASGVDAAYTADGEEDELKLLEVITVDTTSDQDYEWGPVSVAQAFGGILPRKWGVVVKNGTGVTFNATGANNAVKYTGIKFDIA